MQIIAKNFNIKFVAIDPSLIYFRELAKYKEGDECYIQHYYDDEETFRLAGAVATVIGKQFQI